MATATTKSLSQIVQTWTVAAQAASNKLLDFTVGSVNLALAEAGATLGLWLQLLALQVLSMSRFATSHDADADSWGAQFSFVRLAAVAATGTVTFSRNTTTGAVSIPVGTQVSTSDGTEVFTVTIDTTNTAYSSASGYTMAAGVASVSVPVMAVTAGAAGNVAAGLLNTFVGSLAGVDSVTNAAAFINGLDAENDTAYKGRFPNYLAGLARADRAAILSAIQGVQQGLQIFLVENQNVYGSPFAYFDTNKSFTDTPGPFTYPTMISWPGMFLAVIDDGSGSPSATLLSRVAAAIEAVRGFTITYQVLAPIVVTTNVTFNLTVSAGYSKTAISNTIITALTNFLNGLPLGTPILPLTKIAQVVYDSVGGVSNVVDGTIQINGSATDLTLIPVQRVRAGTITIS